MSRALWHGPETVAAAVAPAHDADPLGVGDPFSHEVLEAGQDVLHVEVVLVADQVGRELVPVSAGLFIDAGPHENRRAIRPAGLPSVGRHFSGSSLMFLNQQSLP